VVFDPEGAQGFNTDYTGFMSAYRKIRGARSPGTVCLIGTGGVGRAVAFGLIGLKAHTIRCVDLHPAKAQALAEALSALGSETRIEICRDAPVAAKGADGIVNCTPLGMVGIGGSPLPVADMRGAEWVFDAVYTPVETPFLQDAAELSLIVVSGYELFFAQGLDAWNVFTGAGLNHASLRAALERGTV